MKIVFMGTPEFAVPALESIIEAGHEVLLVVTQPDKKGNRNKIIPSPVKVFAETKGLKVSQPNRIRKDEEFIESLKQLSPDMIVVAAFGQILPQTVLDIPKYGCINVHGSLLPDLRGASPMQTAVKLGYKYTGVTIMKMDAGLDTGDMIDKVTVNIESKDIFEVSNLLAKAGADLLIASMQRIESGSAVYEKQDDSQSTHCGMISKIDGLTDFNENAASIECKIRAYAEWPNVYTYLDGIQVKIFKAQAVFDDNNGEFGVISSVDKNSFTVNCAEGKLKILELQMQGKKKMSAGDFMRGHKLEIGNKFECKIG